MTSSLLEIDGLCVSYSGKGGHETPAIQNIGFRIGGGEVVALVGESGSGKSTTAHAVAGLLGEKARITSGQICFQGQVISNLSERRFRSLRGRRIGFVPQDPSVSLNPVLRIGKQISDIAVIHGLASKREADRIAEETLERVGISEPKLRAMQYPHQISGGMRQRVLIGMAMLCRPELLIADEPTSALDVSVQKRVLDLMQDLARESKTAILLITHDLGVASDRADKIVVMQKGTIVEEGLTDEVLHQPRDVYTRNLISAAPSITVSKDTIQRTDRIFDEVLLSVKSLQKSFGSKLSTTRAVKDVTFDIMRGETLALVGESGSGKTSTARMLAGLVKPDSGSIVFSDQSAIELNNKLIKAYRRRVQLVYQNPFSSLNPLMSVKEIVREPIRAQGDVAKAEQYRMVHQILESVGLGGDFASRRPHELSGGQKQRVAIARSLILKPDLIVLDEPVSALDVSIQSHILMLLDDLQKSFGLTYLFVSHDLAVVRQISDRVAVMKDGDIVEINKTESVFSNPEHPYTRDLLKSIPGKMKFA
ncbi:dipeptide ABC transporter ATP-binding protein [Brucellaceae bacterium C25G]